MVFVLKCFRYVQSVLCLRVQRLTFRSVVLMEHELQGQLIGTWKDQQPGQEWRYIVYTFDCWNVITQRICKICIYRDADTIGKQYIWRDSYLHSYFLGYAMLHWRNSQLLRSVVAIVAVAKANEIGVCAPLGFFDPLGFAPKNKRTDIFRSDISANPRWVLFCFHEIPIIPRFLGFLQDFQHFEICIFDMT